MIHPTGNHPFWSEDRKAFIHTDELRHGEHLRLADGRTTRVASIIKRQGVEPAYNLEVDGEHVYYVGKDGVLVHNAYQGTHPLGLKGKVGKGGRLLTNLPGGHATAKSIFRKISKGHKVTTTTTSSGTRRRVVDGYDLRIPGTSQLRINPNGTVRIDIRMPGGGVETIHF